MGAFFPHRVTYYSTCHGLRMLELGDTPLRLLRAVRGIDLAELDEATQCCGFGGTFAIKNADTSIAMLTDKVRATRYGRGGLRGDGQFLPDAHRRRALTPARRGADNAHRRDPREHGLPTAMSKPALHPSFPQAARTALADTGSRASPRVEGVHGPRHLVVLIATP